MKTEGQAFLDYISEVSDNKFEIRFSRISTRLRLGDVLNPCELSRLYEAAFLATLCNISFNGRAGYAAASLSDRERVRLRLEREFMAARDQFFGCAGARSLSAPQLASICSIFLTVIIAQENLA